MNRTAIDPQKVYGHLKNKVAWALCDRCGWHWPEQKLNFRDGKKICPNHSSYRESSNMKTTRRARAEARLARQKEPQPKWPHAPEMRAVVGVETLTPAKVSLTRGGANKTLTLTGRNLSSADAITFSSASVALVSATFTAVNVDTAGNTATLTVNAPIGGVNGSHDLLYNGDTFKAVFEVRT